MGHEDCAPLSSIEPFPFAFRLSGSSSISTEATDATARADQQASPQEQSCCRQDDVASDPFLAASRNKEQNAQ